MFLHNTSEMSFTITFIAIISIDSWADEFPFTNTRIWSKENVFYINIDIYWNLKKGLKKQLKYRGAILILYQKTGENGE